MGPVFFKMYSSSLLEQNTDGMILRLEDDTAIFCSADSWQPLKIKTENGFNRIITWFEYKNLP